LPGALPYNEEELLPLIANADRQAFAVFYKKMFPGLFQLSYKMLDNKSEAEDIVADTFIKFWKSRQQFTSLPETAAWLRRTTRNATLDYLKHQQVKNRKEAEVAARNYPQEEFTVTDIFAELLQEIYHQIEQLPPRGKEIFKLRYLGGFSNEEIAQQLGINNQSVRDHLARSLKTLRMELIKKENLFSFFLVFINTK
jgi:RNA polymerase sigma-70 factor (family 1)